MRVAMLGGSGLACVELNCRARHLSFMPLASLAPGYAEVAVFGTGVVLPF